ncbi:hypothetical protein JQC91_17420 [Jannaschia sp. Os4]|uniref:hypothetical protein n=1 Tax=Jannaschia sp. Os4 TaxID=2807617 RepID=UPI00193A55D7|nr:hypothetical protein [Jannaschia sp. Os4]MBM2578090.1 hypothetical protein [Jannaschia sp. Os4]
MAEVTTGGPCAAIWNGLRDLADRFGARGPGGAAARTASDLVTATDYVDEAVVTGDTQIQETARTARVAGADARSDSTTGSCPTCKVAFVIGHSSTDGGADSTYIGEQEWPYNDDVAKRAVAKIEAQSEGRVSAKIFYRVTAGGYGSEMRAVYAQVNAYLEDVPSEKKIAMELHYNSFAGPADYALVLYDSSEGQSGFAQRAASRMGAIYGASRSLIKHYADNPTGHGGFNYGPRNTFLMEPFFGSDRRTATIAATEEARDALAQVYADLMVEWTQ